MVVDRQSMELVYTGCRSFLVSLARAREPASAASYAITCKLLIKLHTSNLDIYVYILTEIYNMVVSCMSVICYFQFNRCWPHISGCMALSSSVITRAKCVRSAFSAFTQRRHFTAPPSPNNPTWARSLKYWEQRQTSPGHIHVWYHLVGGTGQCTSTNYSVLFWLPPLSSAMLSRNCLRCLMLLVCVCY